MHCMRAQLVSCRVVQKIRLRQCRYIGKLHGGFIGSIWDDDWHEYSCHGGGHNRVNLLPVLDDSRHER